MIRRLPFTIGVYAVMAFVFLLLHVNTTFEIAFCIAGITVIGIFTLCRTFWMAKRGSAVLVSSRSRHFCPKCTVFIGLEKELVSSVMLSVCFNKRCSTVRETISKCVNRRWSSDDEPWRSPPRCQERGVRCGHSSYTRDNCCMERTRKNGMRFGFALRGSHSHPNRMYWIETERI